MFAYEQLELDDNGPFSSKFLSRRSKKDSSLSYSNRPLEKGILTKLVHFARTRKHNESGERPTSVCSKCSRRSFESTKKCVRWAGHLDNAAAQECVPGILQPYCEILGSYLCTDCSLERTKKNHLKHLPAIFGDISDECSKRLMLPVISSKQNSSEFNKFSRCNTPDSLTWNDFKEATCEKVQKPPLRLEIEHLSTLPDVIGKRKHELRKWQRKELEARQNMEPKIELKSTLSASLGSTVARYLADVSPMKLIKNKKVKVPCNTPYDLENVPEKRRPRTLNVIELAQKLKNLYRERYLPAKTFLTCTDFDFPKEEDEDLFLESEKSFVISEEEQTYRDLTTSPLNIDILDSKLIQDKLIYTYDS